MDSTAEWLSVLLGLGALAAAVSAAWTAHRLHSLESDRDRRANEQTLWEPAKLVSAWSARHLSDGHEDGEYTDGLVIANRSLTPIFDVVIDSQDGAGRSLHPLKLQVLPPGEYYVAETKDSYHWAFPESVDALDGFVRPIAKSQCWRVTEFTFRDASGNLWLRDATVLLSELHPSD